MADFGVSWGRLALSSFVVCVLVCRLSPLLSWAEFPLLDRWMRWRPARPPDGRIAIVGIQRQEIDEYARSRPPGCTCLSISRATIGRAVTRLKAAGSAVIGMDLLLEVPCSYGAGSPAGHDRTLARALSLPGECVLVAGAKVNPDRAYFNLPLAEFVGPSNRARIVASPVLYNPRGVVRWVRIIQYGTPTAFDMSRVRPLDLVGIQLSPLAAALLSVYRGGLCDLPAALSPHVVECSGVRVPVWPAERTSLLGFGASRRGAGQYAMLINWCGPAGSFPAYSLADVLSGSSDELPRRFAGKIVILGSIAERKHTPFSGRTARSTPPFLDQSSEVTMSGAEIHANALDTLLGQSFVRPVPQAVQIAIILALAGVAATAFQVWPERPALALTGGLLLGLGGLSFLLICFGRWLPVVAPAAAVVTSSTVSAFWGYARVRRRAADLSNEAELREAVTETIVHDLKQPLAAIGALASVIRNRHKRQSGAPGDTLRLLGDIQDQVDRAIGDIDDLLSASPNHQVGLLRKRFDLVALTRELAALPRLSSAHHTIEARTPETPVWVNADPRHISRVLSNLLDNAVKYWPEGGTVVVELREAAPWAEIRVTDQGLGISPEQQQRIFARFERAVPEGVDIPGTGLGLFSAHRIVTAHGGLVNVESQVGVGSTFIVRLPLEDETTPLV